MKRRYDVLIRNAKVYDGRGGPPENADVAIENDRIALIGSLDGCCAALDMDATGLSLAPGFIDVHTHDDFAVLYHPDMGFKSRGGVTTCIVGNCGFGAAPFAEAVEMLGRLTPGPPVAPYEGHAGYAKTLQSITPGVNIGVLAGHGTIRKATAGSADRNLTDGEMLSMKRHLQEALDAGVFGLSTGLIYDPGRYAETDELVELVSVMRGTGALYVTHMRDEGTGLRESVLEAIDIGARGGVGVQISHHKASGRESWGLVRESLKVIEAAQLRGEDVHADQYPYTAGSTSLQTVLENGAFSADSAPNRMSRVPPADVVVASAPGHAEWEGRSIAELSADLAQAPRTVAEMITAQSTGATVILHMMSEDDVRHVLRHSSTMIGSDGIPTLEGKPHPRLYNSFARVLGHYSRELGLFDLSTAIYRMTGFPARKFGLRDRGVVSEGAFADLVLFDETRVIDKGTFQDPNQYPDGIRQVFINGRVAVCDNKVQVERHGRLLRRQV
ncbi:MAG TPA: D-aminoacylase [Burkholderiales bacterium]|nr:D-aminoacylase [Burkholderiales bacterium]